MAHTYHGAVALVDRLRNAVRKRDRTFTFLVGSPLASPDREGGHGVPGVQGMINLIGQEFAGTSAESDFAEHLQGDSATRYQRAFEFLHGRRGQGAANQVVKAAVWKALNPEMWPASLRKTTAADAAPDACEQLEREPEAWILPRPVDHLGRLLVGHGRTLGRAVLTTNFDPLIEVSVQKHGGRYYRTVLHNDGNLGQTVSDGTHIVHLHGYWQGYDTLHIPQQLVQSRPQLTKSLARVVESSTLVVIGYSGWDDVVTRTLADLLPDSAGTTEIMWAFHEEDSRTIETTNRRLLHVLEPGIARGRVTLYRGIDCTGVLSELDETLTDSGATSSGRSSKTRGTTTTRRGSVAGGVNSRDGLRVEVPIRERHGHIDTDRPLFVEPWVGRKQELSLLASSTTPVVFVTGIGGQGKSALAGRFLKENATPLDGRFTVWDWRDCREESDRLATQILGVVERFSDGETAAAQIEVTDIRAVVGVLFNVLRNRRALLVFDNVDQYVDLESLKPVKGLDVLVSEAQTREHRSVFLFTCRPDVRVDESRAVRLVLTGLTEGQTKELVIARGVPKRDEHLAGELYRATEGHPLWMNLVVMQALRHAKGLRGALDSLAHGGATLPDTTRSIWRRLNDQQRDVLHTMAELDRPEPESRLRDILPGRNANRVSRALSALQSFHLIETRTGAEGEPLLGLHPIIRQFVRKTFPTSDREKYAKAILAFLDGVIGRLRTLLTQGPTHDILDPWTQKAELQIRFERYEEATATMAEVAGPLVDRGYSEEMLRLAMLLFRRVNWVEACSSYKHFDHIVNTCLTSMVQRGHDATSELLARYEAAIPGKSAQYIMLCNLRCYAEWYVGNYDDAIQWGQEGERLKERTAVDTAFSTKHNLALALRDGGRIVEAMESFLGDETLEAVTRPGESVSGEGAPFYGNVGRCLFLAGRLDEARVAYVKSAQLLEKDDGPDAQLNRGYIRDWIAELLVEQREYGLAAAAYRAAVCMWEDCSPPRSDEARKRLQELVGKHPETAKYEAEVGWRVEEAYRRWLDEQRMR